MWPPAYDGDDNASPHSDTSGANQLEAGAAAGRNVLNTPQNTELVRLEGVRRGGSSAPDRIVLRIDSPRK
jgi:hypothetical protein